MASRPLCLCATRRTRPPRRRPRSSTRTSSGASSSFISASTWAGGPRPCASCTTTRPSCSLGSSSTTACSTRCSPRRRLTRARAPRCTSTRWRSTRGVSSRPRATPRMPTWDTAATARRRPASCSRGPPSSSPMTCAGPRRCLLARAASAACWARPPSPCWAWRHSASRASCSRWTGRTSITAGRSWAWRKWWSTSPWTSPRAFSAPRTCRPS
mmetsp:Transcript_18515/g.58484  ORF Transcript_18515/g.58484 Transcript_18515/m.58484 type:complete len:213 (-) Transcript_18515:278-916(-)